METDATSHADMGTIDRGVAVGAGAAAGIGTADETVTIEGILTGLTRETVGVEGVEVGVLVDDEQMSGSRRRRANKSQVPLFSDFASTSARCRNFPRAAAQPNYRIPITLAEPAGWSKVGSRALEAVVSWCGG